MSDTVTVRITARQEVSYDQIRTISRETFERYQKLVEDEADDDEFNDLAELIIDPSDVVDAEEFEDVEMRLFHDPVKPPQDPHAET
jgi:hypothetical protein